jgi:hypothetical protein
MCHSVKTWLVFPYWGMVINPMIWIPNNIYIYKDFYSNEMVINPYPFYYIYWLVVSNMVFIVHFIYGMSSFPLKNSYFSRWLLHPTNQVFWREIVGYQHIAYSHDFSGPRIPPGFGGGYRKSRAFKRNNTCMCILCIYIYIYKTHIMYAT